MPSRFALLTFTVLDSVKYTARASILDSHTGCEYDIELDFDASTASTVAWFDGVSEKPQPMQKVSEADKLAAEMWAGVNLSDTFLREAGLAEVA